MSNILFQNSLKCLDQKTPPIWFMRQAGRYHSHYKKLKEKYSFEQLCKNPELASEVAYGPVKEFDFDLAILFSDILFILEGLGMNLKFNPGPIFEDYITRDNYKNYTDINAAIDHLEFQSKAIKLTREILPNSKSLIGFVGGPWTLLRFATNKKKPLIKIEDFHLGFLNDILIPLLKLNIKLQLNSGAEIVMIFDSGLNDIDSNIFRSKYLLMIEDIAKSFPNKIGYYFKGKELQETKNIFQAPLAGIGINSSVSLKETNSIYTKGFIQGNFDENKMLLDEKNLKDEINLFCDHVKSIKNFNGWVCSLGHGINKATPEKNVHLFIDTIRKKFS
tara:strand:- start:1772 stop:2770 length:999 start_codon:yes stop_codon:yes gene_type:complete